MTYRKSTSVNTYHRAGAVQAPQQSEIVSNLQSLINFTEGSARAVTDNLQKRIDNDILRQTSRIRRNELPSEDATRGGYRAATALAMTNAMAEAKSQLAMAATENISDEEWDNKFVEADDAIRATLAAKYGDMAEDEQILKHIETGLTEMMPALTATREANRLKRVQTQRIADATDFFMLNQNMSDEEMQKAIAGFQSQLNLDERSAIKLAVDAGLTMGNPDFLDKLMRMKTSQGVDVISQYPALQDAKSKADLAVFKSNQTQFAIEQRNLEMGLIDGTLSLDDFYSFVNERNKSTGGQFLTPSAMNAIIRRAEGVRIRNQEQALRNQELQQKKALRGLTKAEKQSSYQAYYASAVESNIQDTYGAGIKLGELSPEQQTVILAQSVRDTANAANAQFGRVDVWADNIRSVANANANDVILKDKDGNESLSPQTLAKLNLYKAIPPEMRDQYATGRDAKFINSYTNMVEQGMSPPVAFAEAQNFANRPTLNRSQENVEWASQVVNDQYTHWLAKDISESQKEFTQDYVLSLRAQGMSDEDISKALEHNTYQMGNGDVVMANIGALMTALGVSDPTQVDRIFEGAMDNLPQSVQLRVNALGFDKEELFWDVNKQDGRAYLRGRGGVLIQGSGLSLQGMSDALRNRLTDSDSASSVKESRSLSANWKRVSR